ncbi:Sugar transferase involved in LPS biosynthesis (colanic, teichoic acid) [Thalassobacillus cyri]|uniref:Sugar transferase involved in LPS biosynthesis (Colanic, teichoic acid) n=1 Tax=Thalassobacillus cyri TaxID=571932 RepID=A0A1H4DZC8_9BACI|nr:sugar transferase [Thalassobacillus cyri]SEA78133.1 Sugar transferase involved in LPS biosynthesis (colanic, teichoic acid) [Thalassobacillus cyri]
MGKNMSQKHRDIKRSFDLLLSFIGLFLFGWLILIAYIIAAVETNSSGFFVQKRIGMMGKTFRVIKIKTMKKVPNQNSMVTTSDDVRITKSGKIFRKLKIDELPQLFNVFIGDMSFVGPRPDVEGYADRLKGEDRIVLSIRPGITGPATLYYRNEEEILAAQEDPEKYNREVIYPHKTEMNKNYIYNYSFLKDIYYIFKTIF